MTAVRSTTRLTTAHSPDPCATCPLSASTADAAARARTSDSGSVSIEAVIIIPAFLLFLVLLVGIGRVSAAQADVQAAAVEGARIASLSATAPLAERAATAAMTARLNADHPYCVDPTIVVDAADLALAPGESGQVSVHISCQVRLGDLVGVGFGGTLTLTGDFATPLDPYSLR